MYCIFSGSFILSKKNECHTNNKKAFAYLNKGMVEFYINIENVHINNLLHIMDVIYKSYVYVCQSLDVGHVMISTG